MTALSATELLRAGLLDGVSVLVAGTLQESAGFYETEVAETCEQLGGQSFRCATQADGESALDRVVGEAVGAMGAIDLLMVDGAALFARGLVAPGGSHDALRDCLDSAWNVTRAVINHAFGLEGRGGRVVYVAPSPAAGERAEAARAGLENLARTLSVEWARYGITVVSIAPGAGTPASEVAALTAYLASPAGAYFSGCLLDLRGAGGRY